jgi:hypothetical protein
MAIYLDEQVGPYLKYLLQKKLKDSPKDFVAERLLKMVIADDERKAKIASCPHRYQPMYGFHEICPDCGGLKNGFEEWVNEKLNNTRPVPGKTTGAVG